MMQDARPSDDLTEPLMLPLPRAVAVSGLSRSTIYREALKEPRLLRKAGRRTLVDYRILTALLGSLPIANLRSAA